MVPVNRSTFLSVIYVYYYYYLVYFKICIQLITTIYFSNVTLQKHAISQEYDDLYVKSQGGYTQMWNHKASIHSSSLIINLISMIRLIYYLKLKNNTIKYNLILMIKLDLKVSCKC